MDSNIEINEKNRAESKILAHRKIMVVEDNKDIADALVEWLKESGFESRGVADGISAVQEVHKFKPDLIILDMMLPGGNGVSVLRKLKLSTHTAKIPVIILTGNRDPAYKMDAMEAGASAYFDKPFVHDEMIAEIQKLLRK